MRILVTGTAWSIGRPARRLLGRADGDARDGVAVARAAGSRAAS